MSSHETRATARGLILAALTVVLAAAAEGAFLRDVPQRVVQPDGTVLNLFATGDEYYNRLHDAAGFTILRDHLSGYLTYAVKVDGRLVPSGLVVGRDDPAAAGLEPSLMPDPSDLPRPDELYPMAAGRLRVRAQGAADAAAFSAISNVVVFIRFSDETGSFRPLDTYSLWFNSTNPAVASMHTYFLEASYQRLAVTSTFYPAPTGGAMASYQDSHPRAYYKPYDATTNPDGYTEDQRSAREWALLKAAVDAVASQVPADLNVDANGDGYVDNTIFVVSGVAESGDWANLLWPHRWMLDGRHYPATINGKQVGDYNLQLDGNIQVGVLCHEMTHTLGAPDLYRYDTCSSAPDLNPVGAWDVMATTKNPPQHTSAYLKWRYLGFLSSIPLLTPPATVTLNPLTSPTNNAYRIASPNSTSQYFVVEYRKQSLPFENMVPGSGLVVYRVDTAADGGGDRCGPPDELYVYRPGGTPTSDGDLKKGFFAAGNSLSAGTAINDTTDPPPLLSSGFPGGLSIRDVGTAGDTITFTVDAVAPCSAPGPFALTSPVNGASLAAGASVTLSWTSSSGATSYDVYFGTDQVPPLLGNQTGTTVTVGVTEGASYFWRVAARNSCTQTAAPASGAWAFSVGTSGGITLLADDFEGDLSKWSLGRTSGAGSTSWGIVGCKTAGGQGAVWCAGGGAAQPACTQYAADEGTFLIAGPFSLADASGGTWDFDIWYDVDDGGNPNDPPDLVYWMWSLDGRSYYGFGDAGTSAGWEHQSLRLADLTMGNGTPIVGQPKVYFAFLFISDGATQREGAYVDNVVIKKVVGTPGPEPPRVRRHLPRR